MIGQKPRNKLTAQERHIWTLRMVVGAFTLITCVLIFSLTTMVRSIDVHIPPDLSQAVNLKPGQIPKANVYAFANYVMTALNEWKDDGEVEFESLIKDYSCSISPAFKEILTQSMKDKRRSGELSRVRYATRIGAYTDQHVNVLEKNNTWLVWLDLSIDEYVQGALVKEANIRYPLRVIKDDRPCNVMRMAIDAYHFQPERI